jgi:L-asparaginase
MHKRLLLIHTGGTIGMVPSPSGLVPGQGVVEHAVQSLVPAHVDLTIRTFEPLLDSANIDYRHWNRLLDEIDAWDGEAVIITHGTDTLAFTGAALSQAARGDACVVLCAAMKPLGDGEEARANLRLAIDAALGASPGVWLAMGATVQPAARLVKVHASAAKAFRSVSVARSHSTGSIRFRPARLAILTLSPGLPAAAVQAMLGQLDGAVLRLYGSGTACDDPSVIEVFGQAIAQGMPIRAVSQCLEGGLDAGAYAAGGALWAAGLQDGGDETPEAALVHLWLALSALHSSP